MTIVDCHMHVKHEVWTADKIVEYLDRNGIHQSWVLTWEEVAPGGWRYHHLPVEDVYEAYLKYPTRIVPFYAPDPHREDAADQLVHWSEKGIRGCGELKATLNWDSPGVRKLLAAVERLRMPVLFHMEDSGHTANPRTPSTFDRLLAAALITKRKRYLAARWISNGMVRFCPPLSSRVVRAEFPGYMLDFSTLENALRDYPAVDFVAHGPMFWKHISADAPRRTEVRPTGPVVGEGVIWRLLREYPNLHADMSAASGMNALSRDPENARRFLSEFEDKILYGTDNLMLGQKEFLDSLGLASRTYSKIYCDNACRLMSVET